MAKQFLRLNESRRVFIERQHIFFTATAASNTRVNISPRSTTHFHVLDDSTIAYLDLTGSGSETSAHLRLDPRMTIMFCAFEGAPLILRLYGQARVTFRGGHDYMAFLARHYDGTEPPGTRQIVFLAIDLVQTSCGYAVPFFSHEGERDGLDRWARNQGETNLRAYRARKNAYSMDGLPTGHPDAE